MGREGMDEKLELMRLLVEMQKGCAPIKLSIGHLVNGRIVTDGIIIHEAPAVVMDRLVAQGWSCSTVEGGVLVYRYGGRE